MQGKNDKSVVGQHAPTNRAITNRIPHRTRKNGGEQGRKNSATIGITGFHLLSKQLRTITQFEAEYLLGGTLSGSDAGEYFLKLRSNEEQQLAILKDLYAILKAQPEYGKMKQPSWNEQTTTMEVLTWVLKKLAPLAKGKGWGIDAYQQGSRTRYSFVVVDEYHSQKVIYGQEIPLEFLPYLKVKDEQLHDIVVEMVAYVCEHAHIQMWYEDNDFLPLLKTYRFCNEETSHQDIIQAYDQKSIQRWIYSSGPAAKYAQLFAEKRKVVSSQSIHAKIKRYDSNSQRKNWMISWVKEGLRLVALQDDIRKHTFIPNYGQDISRSISPYRDNKFVWSLNHKDFFYKSVMSRMKEDARKYGQFRPIAFSITKPGQVIKPPVSSRYPFEYCDFMKYGMTHLNSFREYYFKDTYYSDAKGTLTEQYMTQYEKDGTKTKKK